MTQRCRDRRRPLLAAGALACVLAVARSVAGATGPQPPADADASLYRIFLRDGGTLLSYGEFAQVADRVVLSMPIGGSVEAPTLHLLSIPQDEVDWERTNAYAYALRARRYAETRGEADFAAFSREVANTLNRIAFVTDPAEQLALGEAARRRLLEWPEQHYNYRGDDIWQMGTWLDQVVSELRIAAGKSNFDLAFVARAVPQAASVPLLPPPTARERAELGLAAARRTADSAERTSLLRAIVDSLAPLRADGAWAAEAHARASADLARELVVDRAYADVTRRALEWAEPLVRRANVRALEVVVQWVLEEDRRLAGARPAAMASLMATLDARVDAARRLRLARDAWALRAALLRTYWQEIRQGLDRLLGIRSWLTDVRQLAGPAPRSLKRLAEVAALAQRDLAGVKPPVEAASPHATLVSVSVLASRAAAARLEAVRSGSMDTAWQASSAAAGALMLLDQAIAELGRLTREPVPVAD